MLRTLIACFGLALLAMVFPGEAAMAKTVCSSQTAMPHAVAKPGAAQIAPAAGRRFRLAEGSNRACAESCVAQCRAAQQSCSGDAASCRAQFQICARRCVVSCGK
jgi:hypothetical protein